MRRHHETTTHRRHEPLVHYLSPFGTPAWMTRAQAQFHLAADDALWETMCAVERDTGDPVLSEQERRHGPPRIEVAAR